MARKRPKSVFFQVKFFKEGRINETFTSNTANNATMKVNETDFDTIRVRAKWGWGDNEAKYDNKKQALQFIKNNAEDARDYINNYK